MTINESAGCARKRARQAGATLGVGVLFAVAGCSGGALGGSEEAADAARPIKIGYVSPQTGSLAAFGEADSFGLEQVQTYYKENGIEMGDGRHDVEIIVKDTQSDAKRAGDVAAQLILEDDVDLILVSSTPETVNPVTDQCEANGVLCISTVAPWQAFYFGRGGTEEKGFDWTYHFFWGTEDAGSVYADMWQTSSNADSVGMLLPNDADGKSWNDPAAGFPPIIEGEGLTANNPGLFPVGTTDFTAQISEFKNAGNSVLMGVPIPPDFTTFWKQAVQQGYQPEVATIAKAILFPSAMDALGDTGHNLGTEVWWTPTHPFKSSLNGQTAAELGAAYEQATGRQWTQPLGYVHALFEVATAALEKTQSLDDPALLRDNVADLKVDTIAGTVDWTSGPVPNVAKTPLVGGQWRLQDDGSYDLVIVSNKDHPEIPAAGEMELLNWDN
ncbi:ABC transporter substrate-binding protein [Arthrobacter sp. zg-ZUI100]|uniref:ABC transporter substrate-binding protein n=1 Tax=Arthrobacter jiangjiafuii TaxID=2817475 RepID=UPI001AEE8FF0|nr:ABC transporter substrate-binding protein [Arthrobacter jiangjiafuii]MBP3035898.1 ABC transporter substrate-binding protein [Arthrobacter jiangjiafuii]